MSQLGAAALSAVGRLGGQAAVAGLTAGVAGVAGQSDLRGALQLRQDPDSVTCQTHNTRHGHRSQHTDIVTR